MFVLGPFVAALLIRLEDARFVKALVMPAISQDTAMGAGIVTLCVMLWFRERWLLEQTRKGQRLVEWCGPARAPWVLRAVLLAGITFGGLLAYGVIRPVQW